jgi:hypothetical protein
MIIYAFYSIFYCIINSKKLQVECHIVCGVDDLYTKYIMKYTIRKYEIHIHKLK